MKLLRVTSGLLVLIWLRVMLVFEVFVIIKVCVVVYVVNFYFVRDLVLFFLGELRFFFLIIE